MKLRTIFTAAMAALVMATACNKENPSPVPSDQEPLIKVSASLYQFTKATDTAFEEGDEIGVNIFKGEEVYLYNASFTNTLGSFEPAVAHKWYKESDVVATITAVYPRTDALDSYSGTATFTVNADQSEKEGYKASDLLLATATSAPTESAISLPFKHALSKISITIDNKLEEEIQNVWFTDVYGSVTYDPKAPFTTLETSGSKGTVKAYKSGDNSWVLIVAPQEEVAPKLALTTASGKQYTFILDENVTFTSGKVSTATVEVKETSIYTSFTPEISDWVADNELNFSQDDTDVELPEQGTPVDPVTPQYCRLTFKVNKAIEWYDKYIYSWTGSSNSLTGVWPGAIASYEKEEGDYYVYYYDFPYSLNGTEINYIINNSNGGINNQTYDLTVTLEGENTTVTIESANVKVTE